MLGGVAVVRSGGYTALVARQQSREAFVDSSQDVQAAALFVRPRDPAARRVTERQPSVEVNIGHRPAAAAPMRNIVTE